MVHGNWDVIRCASAMGRCLPDLGSMVLDGLVEALDSDAG